VDVDRGQFVGRDQDTLYVVMPPAACESLCFSMVPMASAVPVRRSGMITREDAVVAIPVFLPRQHVPEFRDTAVFTAVDGEPLERKRRPRTVPQQMVGAFLPGVLSP